VHPLIYSIILSYSIGAKTVKTLKTFREYPRAREYPFNVILLKRFLSIALWRMAFPLPNRCFPIKYYGGKIYLNLKESRPTMNMALGIYEYWKTKLFFNIVKEGMTIVDIGAHNGYFSLLFAKLMNDKGNVLSFEPDLNNCFWFRKSIQVNGRRCIKLFQYTLSDREGSVDFYRGKTSGMGSLFLSSDTEEKVITVKTRKLDNVLKDEGINKVDLIKIDVQGADLLVLKGAERTLKRQNIKLAMDVDVKSLEERNQVFDFLGSCGFKMFRISKELTPIEKIDERTRDIYAMKP